MCSSLSGGANTEVEGCVGALCWRGGAVCSLLGGGATAEVEGCVMAPCVGGEERCVHRWVVVSLLKWRTVSLAHQGIWW